MKVTLNWLKQYVDFDWSPEELTGRPPQNALFRGAFALL